MGAEETNSELISSKNSSYLEEIEKIENSKQPIESSLALIDVLFRDFLAKKFHISKNGEYDELVDYFLQKNKPEIATYCYEMVEALYSGEKINQQKLSSLVDDLKTLIEKEQNLVKEEKKESSILNLAKLWQKNRKSSKSSSSVSKQIKKLIDLEIGKYDMRFKPSEKENVLLEIASAPKISIKKEPAAQQYAPGYEEAPHPSIEHIDNLERIRKRIEERKKLRTLVAE